MALTRADIVIARANGTREFVVLGELTLDPLYIRYTEHLIKKKKTKNKKKKVDGKLREREKKG